MEDVEPVARRPIAVPVRATSPAPVVAGIGSNVPAAVPVTPAISNREAGIGRITGIGGRDMPDGARNAVPGNYSLVKSSLSNKGNPTAPGFDNMMLIEDSQEIRLVDSGGNILFSGIGADAARKAVSIGDSLSKEYGNQAGWKIQQGQKIANGDIRWDTMANEKVNVDYAMMALNAAVQIGVAVATAGMSIPAQAAIAAGTSAALTLAQGGNLTDAIKAGVMSAAPTLGAAYLGPLVQTGTNAAGKVVATTLGKAVAAGGSSTAMGLITGQSLEKALTSGAVSAAGQVLAAELASSKPDELTQWASDNGIFDIQGGAANIDQAMAQISAGTNALGGVSSVDFAAPTLNAPQVTIPSPAKVPGIGDGSAIEVTAQALKVPAINVASPVISGLANAVQQAIPAGEARDIEVTAQEQPAPLYETGPALGGLGEIITPDILVTAQNEAATTTTEEPALGGLAELPPEIIATAQRDAAATTQEEPADLSPEIIATAQRDAIDLDEKPLETETVAGVTKLPPLSVEGGDVAEVDKDDKSILDILGDVADVVGAVAPLLPLLGGGDGDGSSGDGNSGPGLTLNPNVLTPTVTAETVSAAGGRYPYTPTTYGIAGGDQETEYEFFTRSRANPVATPVTTPAAAPGRKEGGEINDDMVKHLVEYRKGGGHQGPGKVTGIGSGQEDLIPAWLSDGEYVWSAQDVADLGDGSTDEGVRRLDKMRQMVRRQAGRKDVKKIAKPQKGIDKMLKAVGGQA
jgi:hypothetical protein